MAEVSIRELRNHGGDVVERASNGERITITRRGRHVAELRPVRAAASSVADLVRSRAHLPTVDPTQLRADIDAVLDATL